MDGQANSYLEAQLQGEPEKCFLFSHSVYLHARIRTSVDQDTTVFCYSTEL